MVIFLHVPSVFCTTYVPMYVILLKVSFWFAKVAVSMSFPFALQSFRCFLLSSGLLLEKVMLHGISHQFSGDRPFSMQEGRVQLSSVYFVFGFSTCASFLSQSSSIPFPGMSIAHGWMLGLVSSQSVTSGSVSLYPAGFVYPWVTRTWPMYPSLSSSLP